MGLKGVINMIKIEETATYGPTPLGGELNWSLVGR